MLMKTLIAYSSKYGTALLCAQSLQSQIGGEVTLVNLADQQPDPSEYDQVIVGGSIYFGQIQHTTRDFCQHWEKQLLSKPLGLFVCCAQTEKYQEQLTAAFSEKLRSHARFTSTLGYAYDFKKMRFIDRLIIKKVAKVSESRQQLDQEAIRELAAAMA